MRVLSIAALCFWGAPRLARAAAPVPGSTTTESWPLAFTRAVHAARLRARGATITVLPRHRLQQTPNDCALAVVDELQRAARRPIPDRAWLARALALGVAGVPLDSLAPTLRRLGWFAHTTRGAPSLLSHPLHPPAIALMHPGHFVLVTGHAAAQVQYFDPLVGLVQQPQPAFEARWTGKGVQLSTRDN